MQVKIRYIWGSFAIMTVSASLLISIIGASADVRKLSPRVNVNRTASEWSNILKLDQKNDSASDNPSLHAPINPKMTQADELGPSVVHSSFEETSQIVDDKLEVNGDNTIAGEQRAEVGNGLTDTGQGVVLSLVETDSSQAQLQTESLGFIVASDNLSDLLSITTERLMEEVNDTSQGVENIVPKIEEGQEMSKDIVAGLETEVLDVDELVKEAELPIKGEDSVIKEAEPAVIEEAETIVTETQSDSETQQPPDDIPSFSEWAQKQLEEAEKNKVHNITVPVNMGTQMKLRSKNYASPDCGAKIVAANPEAVSASSVLSPSRDEYLLSPCMNRIWLVMELCDSIQAKKIDIANFELFSSSPKELAVSVSDRYPTRDWHSVGQFTANDVRDIQGYNLHPHLFGKFVKVEIKSHYGSEHFCPVSLIRVYGTSEFEVLETEDEVHQQHDSDDEDEGSLLGGEDSGSPPRNLYGIARDAVKSIVKAAEALVIRSEPTASAPQNTSTDIVASTPSHMIICDNCSNVLFNEAFVLLEQQPMDVYSFVNLPFVKDALHTGLICANYGLDFGRRRAMTYPARHDPGDYLSSLLPPHYVVAMCNALAVVEKKSLVNTSQTAGNASLCHVKSEFDNFIVDPKATCSVGSSSCPSLSLSPDQTVALSTEPDVPLLDPIPSQINPSKPINSSDDTSPVAQPTNILPSEIPIVEPTVSPDLPTEATVTVSTPPINQTTVITSEVVSDKVPAEVGDDLEANVEHFEEDSISEPLDSLLSELKELDTTSTPAPATAAVPPLKESVFVRITNRIKALERNMSLSSQYLEELSRRYKRQVEEMSRTLNRTLANVEIESKKRDERELLGEAEMSALQEKLATLNSIVVTLVAERDGWNNKVSLIGQHLVLIAIEVFTFVIVWYIWRLLSGEENLEEGSRKWSFAWRNKKVQSDERRRSSVDGVSGHQSPSAKRKRPSEVALNIAGTYTDLLISEAPTQPAEGVWCNSKADQKRRRRKRKDAMSKSVSSAIMLENPGSDELSNSPHRNVSVRRSSLSELGSVSIPVNGVQREWDSEVQDATKRIEELPKEVNSAINVSNVLKEKSNRNVISVPKPVSINKEGVEEEKYSKSILVKRNLSLQDNSFRRLSSPSFMKTAMSSRAKRCVSEEPIPEIKAKSEDWDSLQSSDSPTSSLASEVNGVQCDGEIVEQSQQTGKKKGNSLKKIVKRFF